MKVNAAAVIACLVMVIAAIAIVSYTNAETAIAYYARKLIARRNMRGAVRAA